MRNIRLHHLGIALLGLVVFFTGWSSRTWAQEGVDDETLQLGAQVYLENCAVCHGPNGEGRVGATLAKDWPSIRPDLVTRNTIANGVESSIMPAWSRANGGPLSDTEIDAVVLFILSWQTGGAPQITPAPTSTSLPEIPTVPNVEGDPNQGAILYENNCEVCHGSEGEGRVGATLDREWPSFRPDLTIKSTISSGVEGSTMPAWSIENGGPLKEAQINDLVAYIMTWSGAPEAEIPTPTPEVESPFTGWLGVILTGIIFVLLIAVILFAQRRG
ncbi:MAG: c-type cytochrome [Anaerolineales bacterium]|jgi:mono/diheme cytochrome c family protein